ncbi:MAG: hypothetical protein WCT40_04825 [Candidatus Magasanikbacteria bacterium]
MKDPFIPPLALDELVHTLGKKIMCEEEVEGGEGKKWLGTVIGVGHNMSNYYRIDGPDIRIHNFYISVQWDDPRTAELNDVNFFPCAAANQLGRWWINMELTELPPDGIFRLTLVETTATDENSGEGEQK